MSDYPERTIRRQIERAENAEGMDRADADFILEVHERIELLGRQQYSPSSHATLLVRGCKMATEVGGLADICTDREATEAIVRWINRTYDKAETNKRYRTALRSLARLHYDDPDGKLPPSAAWIPSTYPRNYDPQPEPGEMFHWGEHIIPMVDAARNSRDRALVTLCWDLGPRTSELYELRPCDFTDTDHGLKVSIRNGKTGSRTPIIIPAVPYVRQWLADHPGDRGDYLWTQLNQPSRVSRNRIRDILKELARRAAEETPGFEAPAPPTPTQLRKSSASYLASQGVSQTHLEHHHGWKRGSDEAARYIAVFGEAAEREIATAHGIEVAPAEREGHAPIECVRCSRETPAHEDRCVWCGQAQTATAAEAAEARTRRGQETLALLPEEKALRLLEFLDEAAYPPLDARVEEAAGVASHTSDTRGSDPHGPRPHGDEPRGGA